MISEPAFPTPIIGVMQHQGMTLRDYFAARALGGLINYSPEPSEHEAIAELCYSLADAMLRARGQDAA
jgi:hypothetical protein